jgi:UDP-N-acetylmuramyl pentapeptide phosphotransferase/UDP-N-acetylglucosamine-1-phosphate transferase
LLLSVTDIGWLLLSFLAPLLLILVIMPRFLKYLIARGRVVDDVHKTPATKVPSPVGPVLFATLVVGELVAYLFIPSAVPLAIIGVVAITFAIGLADDLIVLGAKTKPLLLIIAAVPLIAAQEIQPGVYRASLYFPILGQTSEHFFIYTILVLAAVPVVSNAFNMMDSFNGEMSGFALLTSIAVAIGIALRAYAIPTYSISHLATALPLVAVSLGFYFFNRYPSRCFDGDSGSLALGATFAALAVTGGVEIAAVVALIPAILNSFYILSSVRGFVERRKMGARPTYMTGDGQLHASSDHSAPITLIRMILLEGPLTERALVKKILILAGIACLLSVATSLLTWVY